MTKRSTNEGIQTQGGHITATNIAVGRGAKIVISGNVSSEIRAELDAIREIVAEADVSDLEKDAAGSAIAAVEEEIKKQEPDRSVLASALETLEKLGKVGGTLVPLGEKLAPHIAKLAGFLA